MNDPFMSCPYNKSHRVLRSRIQYHLVKCEKNYPQMHICPYNATHRFRQEAEFIMHIKDCPSKEVVRTEIKPPVYLTTPKSLLQKDIIPKTDPNNEDWDE